MFSEISRDEAMKFLSRPDVAEFWSEIGRIVELPDRLIFVKTASGLVVFEPFDGLAGIHVAYPKGLRGVVARREIMPVLDHYKQQFSRILARIEAHRREVSTFAKWCGLKEYSRSDTHVFLEI